MARDIVCRRKQILFKGHPMLPTPQLADLALSLVRIPSESGHEAEVARFIESLAVSHGFVCEHILVEENRWNLLITTGRYPQTLLTTHIDTVPGGPEPRIENGILWGRGSCDAKGIAAAMFCALCDLRSAGRQDIGLLLVVGEETRSDGAKVAAKKLAPVKRFINGEPTELQFVSGQKGVLKFTLSATGKCAHSGYPELGHSAIHTLLDVLQKLLTEPWPCDPRLGKTLVNVGVIEGGIAANVTAPSAGAQIIMRLAASAEQTEARVRSMLPPNVAMEIDSISHPQVLNVPPGEKSIVVGYGSDVPHLRPLGEPLMYGPGTIHLAHTDHEHVSLTDLETARQKYVKICLEESVIP